MICGSHPFKNSDQNLLAVPSVIGWDRMQYNFAVIGISFCTSSLLNQEFRMIISWRATAEYSDC